MPASIPFDEASPTAASSEQADKAKTAAVRIPAKRAHMPQTLEQRLNSRQYDHFGRPVPVGGSAPVEGRPLEVEVRVQRARRVPARPAAEGPGPTRRLGRVGETVVEGAVRHHELVV